MVLDIARQHNVKSVVKSKSMVTEEMEVNHVLAAEGIRAIETDLGEYIVQLAQAAADPHHHAGHALFRRRGGRAVPQNARRAEHRRARRADGHRRKHLRAEYLAAGMGISGCNFAVADSGTVVVVENEGNAGLSTATPPVHVVTVGIEKIIPRIDYLPLFLNLLGRIATAQKLTTYTHLIHGPAPGKKLYVIFLDNGRSKVLQDPHAWQSLFCIRCGACLNACPVYRRVGGWSYGWIYPGPIGSILTPHLVGLEKAGKLPFASSLVRGLRRGLPGEDRHPAPAGPSPPSRGQRAFADEFAAGPADVAAMGLGDGRPAARMHWRCGRSAWASAWRVTCRGIPAS